MSTLVCRYCASKKELTSENFKVERRTALGFDMTIESDREKCFHYSNMQPLLAAANLIKGATMPDGTIARKKLTISKPML